MKTYTMPEMKFFEYSAENIVMASDEGNMPQAAMLKTEVNGNTAASYGAQSVSIFD